MLESLCMPSYAWMTLAIKMGTSATIRRLYFQGIQSIEKIRKQTGMFRKIDGSWFRDPEMVELKYPACVGMSKFDAHTKTLSLQLRADCEWGKRE